MVEGRVLSLDDLCVIDEYDGVEGDSEVRHSVALFRWLHILRIHTLHSLTLSWAFMYCWYTLIFLGPSFLGVVFLVSLPAIVLGLVCWGGRWVSFVCVCVCVKMCECVCKGVSV